MRSLPILLLGFSCAVSPLLAVSINQPNVSFTENFDVLAQATSSVVPMGWEFAETGSGANTTYGASPGSTTTGNTYSFGTTGSSDRAFGSIRTSSVASTLGSIVSNDTGSVITDLTIGFTGEQWRLGALGRVDRLDFSYSLDATSVTTGAWLDVDDLDFTAPVTAGTVGALDGNLAENRLAVSYTLSGLNLAPGGSLWLRWVDFEASGSDDGLALDDFSILALTSTQEPTPQNVPDHLPPGVAIGAIGTVLLIGQWFRRREGFAM